MKLPDEFSPLAEPLLSTCELIRRSNQKGMIIGAIAVGLVARPRHTDDVDAVVWCPHPRLVVELLEHAGELGLEPRQPDALQFAELSRVLLLRHIRTEIDVDVSLGQLSFEREALARRVQTQAGELSIPCATADDLVVMKLIAHRDQDLLDIANLIKNAPNINRRRIVRWVAEFARLLDSPELVDEVKKMLNRASRRKKRPGP